MNKCSYLKYGGTGLKRSQSFYDKLPVEEEDTTSEKYKLNIALIENLQLDVPNPAPIKELLEQGANPNIKHRFVNTYTTITNVIKSKHGFEILKLLLEYSLDPNLQDTQGYFKGETLLLFVIKMKSLDFVKLLIKHHALVDLTNDENETPLITAVSYKAVYIVEFLLEHNADPNILTNNHITALHIASHSNSLDIVKLLIKYNADVNVGDIDGLTPLTYAVSKNNLEVIKELTRHCTKETLAQGIVNSFLRRDLQLVKILIEDESFDIIYEDDALLMQTMRIIFEQFLQTFSDYDLNIIKWISSYIGKYVFEELMQTEQNVLTELMYIYSSDVSKIDFLISLNANVENIHPDTGDTSLIVSAKNPYTNIEIVKCLLRNVKIMPLSQFINIENNQGETALMLFVNFSDNIVKLLIKNGGDINYRNKYGETFFMHACKSSFDINYLIKNNANIDNQDSNGETALMWAIKDENDNNVKTLLKNNPNILLENTYGKNSYHIALEVNNVTILRLLSEYILENNIDIPSTYHKFITKYTSDYNLSWKESCKIKDRVEIQKYKELLRIDETDIDSICEELDSYEHKLEKYKEENIPKCINADNLDGNDVKDIYPENFYTYTDNKVTYCEDIRTLFKLLKSFKKRQPPKQAENPYTGKPFEPEVIQDIENRYKIYNIISTGKQVEDLVTPTTPSSKDIFLGQLPFFYNIMKNLSSRDIFISSNKTILDTFIRELEDIRINNSALFNTTDLQKVKHDDIEKYKYQLIQLLLSKVLVDKHKYIEGEQIFYPTRDAIGLAWNKIFK